MQRQNQGVEFIRMAGKGDFGRIQSEGRLDIAAISDMPGSIVDGHVDGRDEHVDHIANHSTNNQRINGGSHAEMKGRERERDRAGGDEWEGGEERKRL